MYHYTESGLLNVWLAGGYTEIETAYGNSVTIDNIEGLHEAIAESLMEQPFLSGREFRFLRVELSLTQREFGDYLGVGPQSVAQWEKSAHVLAKADQMIRALYQNVPARDIVAILQDAEEERFDPVFRLIAQQWRENNRAA